MFRTKNKAVIRRGITAVLIHKNRILLIKRRYLPFIISNYGIWSFLFGGKKENESYASALYREIKEETGIDEKNLNKIIGPIVIELFDDFKGIKWKNMMYILHSKTNEVDLDIENSDYRWATYGEIINRDCYTNIFCNENKIEKLILDVLNGHKIKK
jgi:8-oxo-dGTP pyrophosphatase MutT (NUDIX family)